MEGFGKIVKDLKPLTNLAKSYILGVWQSSEYAPASLLTLGEGPYHIETSPLICSANQWTVFYMVGNLRHERVKIKLKNELFKLLIV